MRKAPLHRLIDVTSHRSLILAFVAVVGSMGACCASAQTSGFVAGGLGVNTIQTDFTEAQGTFGESATFGKSNVPVLQLEGGARFGHDSMQFGIGLFYHPLTYKADEVIFDSGKITTKVKDLAGLFGEIGWKASPQTVLYGRLSYDQGRMEFKVDQGVSGADSGTFNGIGYGAGMRHSINSNVYLFVDWHHMDGSQISLSVPSGFGPDSNFKMKPSITTGLIGGGWSF
jgi:hypothetical protein